MNDLDLMQTLFICEACGKKKDVGFPKEKHQKLIAQSANGLVRYTIIHKCNDGFPAITNLYVDHNGDVRSRTMEKFPPMVKKKKSAFMVPSPTINRNYDLEDLKQIFIHNQSLDKKLLKLRVRNEFIGVDLFVNLSENNDLNPLCSIQSDFGFTTIEYFDTDVPFTPNLEKWFSMIVNLFDMLPPATLGNLWEILNYLVDGKGDPPSDFDERLMKRILTSHEIIVKLKDVDPTSLQNKLSLIKENLDSANSELLDQMEKIIEENSSNTLTLRDIIRLSDEEDTLKIIYLFLLLETKDIISYETPEIAA